MTLKELAREVSALGFDGTIAIDGLFITSLNRALRQIFGEHSVTGEITLSAMESKPISHIPRLRHRMGESLSLPLIGKAYNFFTSGTGEFTLRDGNNTLHREFSGTRVRFCSFLSEGGDITFSGDYSYLVTDLVTFDQITSQRYEDIPDGRAYAKISVRELVGDFLSFISMPRDSHGRELSEARLEDGAIIVGSDYDGEINLVYRRSPRHILTDEPEQEIDIPCEYAVLLAPLVASYVYLDSEPDKAEKYEELYRSITERELSLRRGINSPKYITNGWA